MAFEARNEQLRKELKKVNEEYEKERSETEKLVPPAVIASMN